MSEREPRKRISIENHRLPAIEDTMAYTRNRCSERARKIKSIKPNLIFDVWFDQHYHIRAQFGDDNGRREGIESEKVEALVLKAMKHLIAYSAVLKIFTFINHGINNARANRIVLKEDTEEGLLNVVIEAHIIDLDTYEVTVKTAMCTDEFPLGDGQFALHIFGNESVLKKLERGRVVEVYHL
ncbi:MAG: hypothetical protein WCF67_00320 [Chitinophagaceae bacterium]